MAEFKYQGQGPRASLPSPYHSATKSTLCFNLDDTDDFGMLFSRKAILTKGKKPLYAASRVINASCGSASSVFARCWVHSTNKTSALLKTVKNQGFRRAYSTKSSVEGASNGSSELPLYRELSMSSTTSYRSRWRPRKTYSCLDGYTHEVVPSTAGSWCHPLSCHSI